MKVTIADEETNEETSDQVTKEEIAQLQEQTEEIQESLREQTQEITNQNQELILSLQNQLKEAMEQIQALKETLKKKEEVKEVVIAEEPEEAADLISTEEIELPTPQPDLKNEEGIPTIAPVQNAKRNVLQKLIFGRSRN